MNTKNQPSAILRSTVLAIGLLGTAGSASAQCCVMDSMSIVNAVRMAQAAIVAAVNGAAQSNASQVTASIIGAQAATSATIRESAAMNAETMTRHASVLDRARQEDRYRLTDPCSVAAPTAMASAGPAMVSQQAAQQAQSVGSSAGSVGGAAPPRQGASRAMTSALDVAQGRVAKPAPEIAAQAAARGACESFAGSGTVRGQLCAGAGFSAGNSVGFQDADIRAETILDGPQPNGQRRKRHTIDLSTQEGTAVAAAVRNAATPVMLRDLQPGELSTDAGRRYMALKDAYSMRMSLAERPVNRHVTQMAASTANLSYVQTLLNGQDAAFVRAHLGAAFPNWQRAGISSDEVMNIEVRRRYLNPTWQGRMAGASPEEQQREMLQVAAFQNVLLWQLIQEMREVGVVSGTAAASQVRTELIPQMAEAHRLATR